MVVPKNVTFVSVGVLPEIVRESLTVFVELRGWPYTTLRTLVPTNEVVGVVMDAAVAEMQGYSDVEPNAVPRPTLATPELAFTV
jgi:hypothetical protein